MLAFAIGAQEETMATTLGSGSLSLKQALMLGASLIFLGSYFFSDAVGTTLGSSILAPDTTYTKRMMYTVLITAIIWMLIGAFTSVPVSLNQTFVGSIVGVMLSESLIVPSSSLKDILNYEELSLVLLGWLITPILAYILSAFIEYIIQITIHKNLKGLIDSDRKENYFRFFLIAFVCLNQISTAGNQAGNALGMSYALNYGGSIGSKTLLYIILGISGAYVLGFVVIGRKLITGLGDAMGNIRPSETSAVEISTSLLIFVCTLIGLPVSAAQILIFSLLGTLRMRGEKPQGKAIRKMIVTWVILLPTSVGFAGLFYFLTGL